MNGLGRAARWALLAVVFVSCAALFYLIAVMGNGDDTHDARQSATLAPAAAMEDGVMPFSAQDLDAARAYSFAPVATLSSGWYLTGGEVRQWHARGQTMRQVRLDYTQNNGTAQVSLSTSTPREYLYTLPDAGFLPASTQEVLMLGHQAALMSDGSTTHLHVALGDAVYQIEGSLTADEIRSAAGYAALPE